MQFLFLVSPPNVREGDKSLTLDLAAALVAIGHKVDLVAIEWNADSTSQARRVQTDYGVRILAVPALSAQGWPALPALAAKWLLSSERATAKAEAMFDAAAYDAIVAFTPCVTLSGLLRWSGRNRRAARVLFIFDFFPIHHREIGLIPGGPIYRVAKWREGQLFRRFETIVCNLPSNIDYLRRHFRVGPNQRVISTPLWTVGTRPTVIEAREEIRRRLNLPLGGKIAVFGGQLTEGRGIEMMLEAARVSAAEGANLTYLFVGGGRLAHLASERAKAPGSNVVYLPGVNREAYLSLLSACDIGMISTVAGVSSHSFPTKLLEYVRVGIPVVASVEKGSDFNKIIERFALGRVAPIGDASAFAAALHGVGFDEGLRDSIGAATWRCLTEFLDVDLTARLVVEAVEDTLERRGGSGANPSDNQPIEATN